MPILARVSELTSTAGIVALVALGLAGVGIAVAAVLYVRLREVRGAQSVVLGDGGSRDVVAHGRELADRVDGLAERQREDNAAVDERLLAAERRLERVLSRASVVRYDAYDEMTGRQSSSIALLDDHADGVLVSSILHREQARVYAKRVSKGDSELGISPEEKQAIDVAMGGESGGGPPSPGR
jgi:hypothetical protein